MATSIEQILGKDINSLKELREEIKRLQDSIAAIDPATQEFKDTTVKLTAAQEQLTAVTRAGKEGNDAATDSIVGMEREYKNLYNTYKMLTEEQRNSDFGKEMAESLNTLSNKLNETKKGVGNFKDNIGRYSESVIDAFSKMGGSVGGLVGPFANAVKGVNAFNAALKANPVGAVIGLITTLIGVVKSLMQGIKGNEESQMRLNQAMASFQPIIDAAKNAMDKMGQAIVKTIEFIANIVDKIRVAKAAFTDFIGITKGAKDAVKEQQKTYKELAASVNNLTKTKREYQKLNAADEAEVQRLREEASETQNVAEKKRLLEEAKNKQAEIDQRNIEIAQEELRILEEQAKLTANDAAMNDKLAEATARVSQAQATAANNMRAFNKQLNAGTTAINTHTTATKNYREEAKQLYNELVENNKSEYQRLKEKYEKEKKLLEKYHLDTTLLTKKFNEDVENLYKKSATDAARKASEGYMDAQRRKLGEYDGLLADEINTQFDVATREVQKLQAKQNIFNDYYTQIMSAIDNPKMKEQVKLWIDEMNELLGTNINFPPEANPEAMEKFKDNMDTVKLLFKDTIKAMEASAKKAGVEESMKRWTSQIMEDRITELTLFQDDEGVLRELMAKEDYKELELKKKKQEEILKIEGLSLEERLEAQQNYYATLEEMHNRWVALQELDAERTQNAWNDSIEAFSKLGSSLSNISQSYETVINAKLKDGKITKEQAEKQKKALADLEKTVQWVNIASVVAQTAAGIMGVWKAYALEKVANAETAAATGPAAAATLAALNTKSLISAIAQTAGLAATGIAQVASIRANTISRVSSLSSSDSGGGSAAGTAASPIEIDSTPYTYTRTLQTQDEEDELNRPIYVTVTDINDAQNRVRVRDNESSF